MDIDSVELKPVFTTDARIQYILDQCKIGCKIFVDAIRQSSEEQVEISFKAFTLQTENKEEADSVFEIIMTGMSVQLKEEAGDLIDCYTFYNSQEETGEGEYCLLLHCRKEKAPKPEEKVVELEEETVSRDRSDSETPESLSEVEKVVLPHASGMHYFRPGSE